ncbi:hypothetical protein TERTU_1779 [Teredinibacter turnerae T7901]|uniref:Lipoprotein n=1 Tax=Teredinibacter turnerae (strain ATCC 39867 / T7901) TaxID=377629 RepID=C5BUB0_TERTT|nr:hypothetical protein [Teredinibacter turnerae]ACR13193.1 hypothetical protein TERTU_1779 [Teredinibacter turnerae T7901]
MKNVKHKVLLVLCFCIVNSAQAESSSIVCEAMLLKYEKNYVWSESVGERYDDYSAPLVRFKVNASNNCSEKEIAIVFLSSKHEGVLKLIEEGAIKKYLLTLPDEFVVGDYGTIDSSAVIKFEPQAP